jgi:hypothetical protein
MVPPKLSIGGLRPRASLSMTEGSRLLLPQSMATGNSATHWLRREERGGVILYSQRSA